MNSSYINHTERRKGQLDSFDNTNKTKWCVFSDIKEDEEFKGESFMQHGKAC